MFMSTRRRGDDPFRPEPAARKVLRLAAALLLLAGAACCVFYMPSAAGGDSPVTLGLVGSVAGALACIGLAAVLFTSEW